jgi:hypothetical protein
LLDDGIDDNPRKAFLEDLLLEATDWKAAGDHLIIMGDFNEDVQMGAVYDMFDKLEMVEAITTYHENTALPATYKHNQSGTVIDGIWITRGIQVRRAGYTSFGDFDHRTVWIDVQQQSVFGHKILPTTSLMSRRLQLRLPYAVHKNQTTYRKWVGEHHRMERATQLRDELYTSPTTEGYQRLERLDEQRTQFMLAAEKQCRKIHVGRIAFLPTVNTAGAEVRFLRIALTKRNGKKVSSRYVERLRKKTTKRNYPWQHIDLEDLKHDLAKARKKYRLMKPLAKQQRKSFLEELAESKVKFQGGKVSQRIKELVTIEEQRRQARAIRFALGKTRGGGVDMVITPGQDGSKIEHFTEKAIVHECLQENKAKYTQCYPTPMLQEPMLGEIGYLGFTPQVEEILHGTYQPPDTLDPLTMAFLDELKKPDGIALNSCSDTIPVQVHIQAMQKVKENTSSGLSGLHYGLWKANAKITELATLDAMMREIPYKTGYVMERWKKGIDVELCKEPGNFNLERLRTIVLLEADYNTNCKKIGRDALHSAETQATDPSAIAPEQYGSRKRHRAVEVCLNMKLVDDILRQMR